MPVLAAARNELKYDAFLTLFRKRNARDCHGYEALDGHRGGEFVPYVEHCRRERAIDYDFTGRSLTTRLVRVSAT